MKYFVNINSFEELKKAFREYTVKLHPDKGGDATEFAAMMAEYETAAKNFNAWTKAEREEVAGIVRGMRVFYFGYGMNCTEYVITKIEGDTVTAYGRLQHQGTKLHVWQVDIKDSAGDLISTVRVTNFIIRQGK